MRRNSILTRNQNYKNTKNLKSTQSNLKSSSNINENNLQIIMSQNPEIEINAKCCLLEISE